MQETLTIILTDFSAIYAIETAKGQYHIYG